MKFYRKEVGRSYYRAMMESYGEINIRTGFQFNKLFYYLAATNLVMNEEEGEEHAHAEHKYITIDGVDGYDDHKCLMRTKRAIAFAEQLSEIEAYRPEKRFADAVKGLHLFGAGIIYPEEMVVLDIGFTQED